MTNLAIKDAPTNTAYENLIREAFIGPIRTVTVIDDEYPTLKGLLQAQTKKQGVKAAQAQQHNTERLLNIISMCHEKHQWSVDVFDGQSPEWGGKDNVPQHLNHSDLIVLDYHLDGEPPADDGGRARQIIMELEKNSHFNIVLVHTKGVSNDIETVYDEILKEFVCIGEGHPFCVSDQQEDDIETWLDDNDLDRERFGFIDNQYDLKQILRFLEVVNEASATQTRSSKHLLHRVHDDIKALSDESGVQAETIVRWLVGEQIKRAKKDLAAQDQPDLVWDWDYENGVNFIATGRVFISVMQKKVDEQELIDRLCQSLYKLDASPMHLLMAKIRHEMDERGFEQANNIMANQYAQAGWLYNLLKKSHENPLEHDKAIDLHWEQIAVASKGRLRAFSEKLVQSLQAEDKGQPKEAVKRFFNCNSQDTDVILGHLNAFSCSMPVSTRHLTTGTILEIDGDYWICLSPACDLVPGQKNSWKDRIGEDNIAFKAVQLKKEKLKTANNHAHKNEHIFFSLNEEVKAFCFAEGSPIWDTFYAKNKGLLSDDHVVELVFLREQQKSYSSNLSLQLSKARVVAELRYEYALNLLQRLGANQTRVGLDFTKKEGFLN